MFSYKFENQLQLTKKATIKELKERIGEYLGISLNDFLIKKGSHYGDELNIPSETLFKLDSDNANVYVEFGRPLAEGK